MDSLRWIFWLCIDLVAAYLYTFASGGTTLVFLIAACAVPCAYMLCNILFAIEGIHRWDQGKCTIPLYKYGLFWVIVLALISPIAFNLFSYMLEFNNFDRMASIVYVLRYPSIIFVGALTFFAIYGVPWSDDLEETQYDKPYSSL